jgi:hypothetical protein
MRFRLLLILTLLSLITLALFAQKSQVRVGGREFIPKDLIFADADPKSRVTGESDLADGCKWVLAVDTRSAAQHLEEDCRRYFYRTRVTLEKECPPPAEKEHSTSERITYTGPHCPPASGKLPPPRTESRAISSGKTPDGRNQEIILQPDGTHLTFIHNETGAQISIRYPDLTTDTLRVAAKKPEPPKTE